MSWLRDILWGAVQGLTEFLPVSSSAHLVFLSYFWGTGHSIDNLSFFVALHFGTLISLLFFFRKKIFALLKDVYLGNNYTIVLKLLLIAFITSILAFFLKSWTEALCEYPRIVAGNLVAMGSLLIASKFMRDGRRSFKELSWPEAIGLGLIQAVAVFPGISRSGITIVYLLFIGMSPSDAFVLSFLSGIPVVVAAFFWSLMKVGAMKLMSASVGIVTSFVIGMLALYFLRKVVIAKRLYWFGIYCWIVAVIVCSIVPR